VGILKVESAGAAGTLTSPFVDLAVTTMDAKPGALLPP
jgi:hypothetical protein